MCSVFAGVYNEYIIKGGGADLHIMIHNIFMYIDSIICNIVLLCAKVLYPENSFNRCFNILLI